MYRQHPNSTDCMTPLSLCRLFTRKRYPRHCTDIKTKHRYTHDDMFTVHTCAHTQSETVTSKGNGGILETGEMATRTESWIWVYWPARWWHVCCSVSIPTVTCGNGQPDSRYTGRVWCSQWVRGNLQGTLCNAWESCPGEIDTRTYQIDGLAQNCGTSSASALLWYLTLDEFNWTRSKNVK